MTEQDIQQALAAAGLSPFAIESNPATEGEWVIWPHGEGICGWTGLAEFIERHEGTEQQPMEQWQKNGTMRYDENGEPIVVMARCGHCGREWNDAITTDRTPAPSGRCPFEDLHEEEDDTEDEDIRRSWETSDEYAVGHENGYWDAMHDANAHDLLEAVLAILPDLERYVSPQWPGPDDRLDALKAAIAKAEAA